MIPAVCSSMEADDSYDEYETGSMKVETYCEGDDMIVKSTEVTLDYEKNDATKEEMLQAFTAQCKAKQ